MTALVFVYVGPQFLSNLALVTEARLESYLLWKVKCLKNSFYAYGSLNTDHSPVSKQKSTTNFPSSVISFVLCYYFGHAVFSQVLL